MVLLRTMNPTSVKQYLAALSTMRMLRMSQAALHVQGPSPFASLRVRKFLDILRAHPAHHSPRQPKPPIPWAWVEALPEPSALDTTRLRNVTAIVFGLYFWVRRSEAARARLSDLTRISPAGWSLHIPRSKTDQAGQGATVNVAGSARLTKWLTAWLTARGPEAGTLFPQCRPPATGRCVEPTKTLQPATFGALVRKEVGPEYTYHGCRKAGAMRAWAQGVSIEDIKKHGRWLSDAVFTYLWDPHHAMGTSLDEGARRAQQHAGSLLMGPSSSASRTQGGDAPPALDPRMGTVTVPRRGGHNLHVRIRAPKRARSDTDGTADGPGQSQP
jgi:hypothetical protein